MFLIQEKGFVVMLNEIEGQPSNDMRLRIDGAQCRVIEVGRNSTDGKPVSNRSCLTGQQVPSYGYLLVEWITEAPDAQDIYGLWAQEEPT